MANKTFNPSDFTKPAPIIPAGPDISMPPEIKPKRKRRASASDMPGPATKEHVAKAKPAIKMMDTLSLTWEPEWERILHELRITHR